MYRIYCRTVQMIYRMVSYLLPWRKPELIEGNHSIANISQIFLERGWKHPLIVTGPHIYASGMLGPLEQSFQEAEIVYEIYSNTVSNQSVSNVE